MTPHRRISGKLVIATHNPGKLAEMRELLSPYGIEAVSAGELGLSEPDETGDTFKANAAIKAIAAARAAKLPAFADDSGLAVDALGGAPGIYSARWAGETKDFNAAMTRIERLLQERGATAPEQRKAHFVSALCVAWPDDHLEEVEARADGTLVWPPRGTAGFGYDPAFLPGGYDRTFGEMSSIEKHGLPPLGLGYGPSASRVDSGDVRELAVRLEAPNLLWPTACHRDLSRPQTCRLLVGHVHDGEAAEVFLGLDIRAVREQWRAARRIDAEHRRRVVQTAGEHEDPGRLHLSQQGPERL